MEAVKDGDRFYEMRSVYILGFIVLAVRRICLRRIISEL